MCETPRRVCEAANTRVQAGRLQGNSPPSQRPFGIIIRTQSSRLESVTPVITIIMLMAPQTERTGHTYADHPILECVMKQQTHKR